MDAGPDFYHPRALCGLRLDNDQSFSSSTDGLPHTCLLDVVVVPLATWILLLLLILLWLPATIASLRQGKSSDKKLPLQRYRFASARLLKLVGAVLHTLLIIAALLMNILEIVRLYLAHRGAGLLPFTLAGIVLVLIVIHVRVTPHIRLLTSSITLFFWILSVVFTSVKLATLSKLQGPEPRIGGYEDEYHDADQLIDVGVIVGLYAIFVIVEALRLPLLLRGSRASAGLQESPSVQGEPSAAKQESA
ncbi:hypothetical protein CBOM_04981 [Ceraceosorus bombacis]|uniref:Uncharacterized protein n=1 Tax=Ceraceosorus bombacis TaxID=401625 RepID=A0A0N7LA70_9BASI|nr:hypothetical protein CBOM_04981 [Ceraceosorus bombacis]